MANNRNLVVMSASTVANGGTIYSISFNGEFATGYRAALVVLAGGSPSVTITEQASQDGVVFYDTVDAAAAALGSVATTMTSTAGVYVQYAPVFARHNRFKVVGAAASTVSITITTSESLDS